MRMRRHCRTVATVALTLVLALGAGRAWAELELTDLSISDKIEDELLYDRAVPAYKIDVTTSDGIVTLTGTVDNILAKERATRIAQVVKGVRAVVNEIAVVPTTIRSAAEIRDDVEEALLNDPATESYEVDVAVDDDGTVTLSGKVDSWQEQDLVSKVAKGVQGVREVENRTTIDYPSSRPDAEIKAEVAKTLRWDVLVDHALIDVQVEDGEVRLSGTVGSAIEKQEAIRDAHVAGVVSVDASELDVARWARDEELRKNKYIPRTDEEIRQAVNDAMLYDPRVNSFDVAVHVSDRHVTLRGQVDNLKAEKAAVRNARNTVGVVSVESRLKIRPDAAISSTKLQNQVQNALNRDPYLERFEVSAVVDDGVAHLYGAVDSYFEKSQAEEVASGVKGVVAVDNNLIVQDVADPLTFDPYLDDVYVYDYDWYDYRPNHVLETDAEIKEDIKSELWWSPFIDSDAIDVSVEDGVATLTGTVESWSERQTATENAIEGGAADVNNLLVVK